MAKQKFKITNWSAYNNALRQRGSLTVWLDESAIAAWTDNAQPEGRGRPLHYSEISHLVIDSTGLKVFGEGEWKVRQYGTDKHRVWRKRHLAADSVTHETICADLSLSGTTDAQALPVLINQTHRKIKQASEDGAYDVCYWYDALMKKKIRPLISPRKGAQYWPDKYPERNHAVANQHLSGSNGVWKKKVGYHRRSVAETAMFRIKTLLGGHLSLRDYDAQVGEAMAMVNALNRMTLLGMPHSVRIA
ncbi:IS5 family transposase [Pectobacterium carotovorum]|nr:IS5 family transposase [Pectobacterium carotovorum]